MSIVVIIIGNIIIVVVGSVGCVNCLLGYVYVSRWYIGAEICPRLDPGVSKMLWS